MNIFPTDHMPLINMKSNINELNDIISLYKRIRGIKPMTYKTDMDSYHEHLKRCHLYIDEIVSDTPIMVDESIGKYLAKKALRVATPIDDNDVATVR